MTQSTVEERKKEIADILGLEFEGNEYRLITYNENNVPLEFTDYSDEVQEIEDLIQLAEQKAREEERERIKIAIWEAKNRLTMKWDNDKARSTAYDHILYNILPNKDL